MNKKFLSTPRFGKSLAFAIVGWFIFIVIYWGVTDILYAQQKVDIGPQCSFQNFEPVPKCSSLFSYSQEMHALFLFLLFIVLFMVFYLYDWKKSK